MKEKDIVYENGPYWVWKDKAGHFTVMVTGSVASIPDSTYDDFSLAKARCDYFAKTHTPGRNYEHAANLLRNF